MKYILYDGLFVCEVGSKYSHLSCMCVWHVIRTITTGRGRVRMLTHVYGDARGRFTGVPCFNLLPCAGSQC